MVSKDGIEIIGGDIIKETHYEKVGGEIPKEHYKFLEKMLTEGCTLDEYEELKTLAKTVGFDKYQIGPLVRSSYNAANLVK